MKKIIIFALLGVAPWISGCMALTQKLEQTGVTKCTLTPKSATVANDGSVLICADLQRNRKPYGPFLRYVAVDSATMSALPVEDSEGKKFCNWNCAQPSQYRLLPSNTLPQNADEACIPEAFRQENLPVYDAKSFPYPRNSENIQVSLWGISLPRNLQENREWWGYPPLILLPATIAVDIVTFPIQLGIGFHEFAKKF